MAIEFPPNPSNNQSFTSGTKTWIYNSSKDAWVGGNVSAPAFANIAVTGQDEIVANLASDTFTVATGSNISLTTDSINKTLTISTIGLANTSSFNSFTSSYQADSASFNNNINSVSSSLASNKVNNLGGVNNIVSLTFTEYNAIVTPDPSTLYLVISP